MQNRWACHLSVRLPMAAYTESGGAGETAIDQAEAVAVLREKYEIARALFRGFDYSKFLSGTPSERLAVLPGAQEHILVQTDGKERLLRAVAELSRAFALAVPHEEARQVAEEVGFFQAVRTALAKGSAQGRAPDTLDHAIRQIVSRAIVSEEVIDIFAAAGLKKPDLSILSEAFLAEVRSMPQQNLAVELLRKLLNEEIQTRGRRNLVQARSFAELLERAVRAYQNRAVETAQIIEELIQLAREMRRARSRGQELGLSEEEIAFYDALAANQSALQVLGDETLRTLARELVQMVRQNASIDWTMKESVRAKLRSLVKRALRKYGYPPDQQEEATTTVLRQAELFAEEWAA